jgi:hypothetical protein
MGMDVYGKRPTTEAGKYFRNNVWWWRPLADYVTTEGPQEVVSKCQAWQSNDGDGLGARGSKALADWLRQEIAAGRTAAYAAERQRGLDALPMVRCEYCAGTGVRTDFVGREQGMPTRVVEADGLRKGEVGWCNGCGGHGKRPDADTWYGFSVANCAEFATFLEGSGGFKIR